MDRWYSSFATAEWLFAKKIEMVGTLQSKRIGIPPALKETKHRENYSYKIYWRKRGKVNLSSYAMDTLKKKKRTYCYFQRWSRSRRLQVRKTKSQLYKNYMTLPKRMDRADQKMGFYTTKSKSRKCKGCFFVFDRYNLSTTERTQQINSMGNNVKKQSGSITVKYAKSVETRKRCYLCLQKISGVDQKKKKDKLSMLYSLCQYSGKGLYPNHKVNVCKGCAKK